MNSPVELVKREMDAAWKESHPTTARRETAETTTAIGAISLLPAEPQQEQAAAEQQRDETTTDKEAATATTTKSPPASPRKRKSWHANFQQLVEYRARHGHTRPTLSGTPEQQQEQKDAAAEDDNNNNNIDNNIDNTSSSNKGHSSSSKGYVRLCNWVAQQRMRRRQNTLTAPKIAQLDAVGFAWEADRPPRGASADALWQRQCERVRRFAILNGGHTVVPHGWTTNRPLADWVKKQRFLWHQRNARKGGGGSSNALTDERIAKLNAINFVWEPQQSAAAAAEAAPTRQKISRRMSGQYYQTLTSGAWKKRRAQLREFAQEHGHCRVPDGHPVLGAWVRALREEHRQRVEHGNGGGGDAKGGSSSNNSSSYKTITDEHYNEVDQMGFAWTLEDSGDENSVSNDEKDNNSNSSQQRWSQRFAELLAFQAVHGHCRVPQNYAPNKQLGLWVSVQRRDYRLTVKEGQRPLADLHKQRFEKLERAGFEWLLRTEREGKSRADLWMEKYRLLQAFHGKNGNCSVPHNSKDELYNWVHKQKQYYRRRLADKANPLTTERIGLLQALDFPFPQRPEGAPRPPPGSKKRKRDKAAAGKKDENGADGGNEPQVPKGEGGEETSAALPKASAATEPKTTTTTMRNKRRRTSLPRTNQADTTCAAAPATAEDG